MQRSGRGSIGRRAFGALLILLLACRVSPPRNEDWLAIGFRTPEETFRTFQTAVRAEEPDLQRRCFSAGFLAANRLSKLNWREYMDVLREEQPLLRYGIAEARLAGPVERAGDRARLVATSHGYVMQLELVLDEFSEVWAGDRPIIDEQSHFRERVGIQVSGDGQRWIYGQVPLPVDRTVELSDVTELRLGREWKIDGIAVLDEASKGSSPAAQRPRE